MTSIVGECKECPICIEKYTKKRVQITCSSCEYSACLGCIKQYLLGSADDPHCMNCRKGWERDVQYGILGKSFVNGELRKHRKEILYEREKSQFPSTQGYVDMRVEKERLEEEENELYEEIRKIKENIREKNRRRHALERQMGEGKIAERKIENLLKCPKDGCRGYISKSECRLCSNHICRKCMVLLESEDELKEHECDKDTMETAQLILNSSKPCPTCGTRISKVSGCDQMWCPECEVGFSWRTGMKVNGVIHNPHYYEYRRIRGERGVVNRNVGDVVCGGLVGYDRFERKMNEVELGKRGVEYKKMKGEMYECHRIVLHFQNVTLNTLRRELQNEVNNISLRADFIMNKISEDQFMRAILTKDNKREKKQSLLHIYETLVTMLVERINYYVSLDANGYDMMIQTYRELVATRKYIQEQLERVSKNYNVVVEGFWRKESFRISTYKA
jgi:hypothetical protein